MRQNLIAAAISMALGVVSMAASADDNTVVSGKMFADFTNIEQTKNGADTANAGTGIDVKRFYLGIDHKFDDFWSANLTTDFNYSASTGETQLLVKKAYVQAKWAKEFALRAGAADMPWIPFAEGIYGQRYIENTLIDKAGFGNSSDWGLHALGTGGNGFWNYDVAVVNGGGYKNPTRSDAMDVEGRLAISPIPGLAIAVGGYSGEFGKDVANLASTSNTRTFTRGDLLVGYNDSNLRLGMEYFTAKNNKNNIVYTVSTGLPSADKADGYSAWGWYSFRPRWAVFARYDKYNPSQDINPTLKDEYANAGVEWAIRKGVKLAAVYKHDTLKDNSGGNDQKTNEVGVWAEIAF
ncbi:MAG: porin [Rudaea sp.]